MALSNGNGENGKPYVFKEEDFSTLFKTQEGSLSVLQKFNQNSDVLRGIENYRVLIFEANPLSFLTPSHWDSDIIFFVGQGKGTITLVFEKKRESFNIEKGHLMTIPAGVTFYIINTDDTDKLVLSMFLSSIANPGDFVPFFAAGGQNPESFLYAFSTEVLEAAYNESNEALKKIFSQQAGKGVIVKASKEQIKALTAEEEVTESNFAPCQILSYLRESNECGRLFMVDYCEYKKLQDFNMFISFCNLEPGCMNSPFISSRATKIIMVVKGRGRVEMAASRPVEKGSIGIQYLKISSELKPGVVFVIPPGHPMVLMASQDEVLETICYEVNAKGNQKFSLAGKVNLMKNIQKEAKDLAFGTSAEEVDKVLDSQQSDFFLKATSNKLQG
ncbi:vicilin Jug r 6.0101-like isoform X2 [Silene latifolia]|uniref:vicilin Jug r 6.0101-like isoform X2 n=1 Tax=Silene latifolia TaxID=37657 RepID=UPI003D772132